MTGCWNKQCCYAIERQFFPAVIIMSHKVLILMLGPTVAILSAIVFVLASMK